MTRHTEAGPAETMTSTPSSVVEPHVVESIDTASTALADLQERFGNNALAHHAGFAPLHAFSGGTTAPGAGPSVPHGVQRSPTDGGVATDAGTEAGADAAPQMTEEEAAAELERIRNQAAAAPAPAPPPTDGGPPAPPTDAGPPEQTDAGAPAPAVEPSPTAGEDATGVDVPEPGPDAGLPGVRQREAEGSLTGYHDEKAWHDQWVSEGSPVGMDGDDSWILIGQAVGGGGVEGLTGAAAAVVIDQGLNIATRNVPFAAGFIAMGEIALKGPDVWLEQQVGNTWGKGVEGFGKLGSPDWLDKFEGIVDILDAVNNAVGLLSTICFIVAAAGFIVGLFFPAVFPFVALAAKWGLFLGKVNTLAGLVITALRLILMAARVIQIRYFAADPAEQARRAERLRATTQGFVQEYATRRANGYLQRRSERAAQQREAQARRPEADTADGAPAPAAPAAAEQTATTRSRLTRFIDATSGGDSTTAYREVGTSYGEARSLTGAVAEGGRSRMDAVADALPEGAIRQRYRDNEEPDVARSEANARYVAAEERAARSREDVVDAQDQLQSARQREDEAGQALARSRAAVDRVAADADSALAQHRAQATEADRTAMEAEATAQAQRGVLPGYDQAIADNEARWQAAVAADDTGGMTAALHAGQELRDARAAAALRGEEAAARAEAARAEAAAAREAAAAEERGIGQLSRITDEDTAAAVDSAESRIIVSAPAPRSLDLGEDQSGYWGGEPRTGMTVQKYDFLARSDEMHRTSTGDVLHAPGQDVTQMRIHSADPKAPPGSRSAEDWTVNFDQGKHHRMTEDGRWFDSRFGYRTDGRLIDLRNYRQDGSGAWVNKGTGSPVSDGEVVAALNQREADMASSHIPLFPEPAAPGGSRPPSPDEPDFSPAGAGEAHARASAERTQREADFQGAQQDRIDALRRLEQAGEETTRAGEAARARDEGEAGLGRVTRALGTAEDVGREVAAADLVGITRPESQGYGQQTTGGPYGAATGGMMNTDAWQNLQRRGAGAVSDWVNDSAGLIDPTGSQTPQNRSPEAVEDAARNRERRRQWLEQQRANMEAAHHSMVELPPPPIEQEVAAAETAERFSELDLELRRIQFQQGEISEMQVDATGELSALDATSLVMNENELALAEERQTIEGRRQAQQELEDQVVGQEAQASSAQGEQQSQNAELMDFVSGFPGLTDIVPTDLVSDAGEGASASRQMEEGFSGSSEGTADTMEGSTEGRATIDELRSTTDTAATTDEETATQVATLQSTVQEDTALTQTTMEDLSTASSDAQARIDEILSLKEQEQQHHDEAVAAMASWAENHLSLRTTGQEELVAQITAGEQVLAAPEGAM